MESLEKKIRAHFEAGHSLTVVDCLNQFRTIELRKIVSTLRREGLAIDDEWVTNPNSKKKFKRYFLRKESWIKGQEDEAMKGFRKEAMEYMTSGQRRDDEIKSALTKLIEQGRHYERIEQGKGVSWVRQLTRDMDKEMSDAIDEAVANFDAPMYFIIRIKA